MTSRIPPPARRRERGPSYSGSHKFSAVRRLRGNYSTGRKRNFT